MAASVREAGHDVALIDALGENTENVYPFRGNLYVNGLTMPDIIGGRPSDSEYIGVSLAFSMNGRWPSRSARPSSSDFPRPS